MSTQSEARAVRDGVGLALGIGNVGWLLGAVASSRVSARLGVGPTLVASPLVFGPALLLVPAAPQSQPLPFLVAALILASFAGIVFSVTGLGFQQAVTPDRLLGRLNATRRFIVWGVIPLGSLVGGALASQIGLRETLWVSAIGASLSFLPLLLSPVARSGGWRTRSANMRSCLRR